MIKEINQINTSKNKSIYENINLPTLIKSKEYSNNIDKYITKRYKEIIGISRKVHSLSSIKNRSKKQSQINLNKDTGSKSSPKNIKIRNRNQKSNEKKENVMKHVNYSECSLEGKEVLNKKKFLERKSDEKVINQIDIHSIDELFLIVKNKIYDLESICFDGNRGNKVYKSIANNSKSVRNINNTNNNTSNSNSNLNDNCINNIFNKSNTVNNNKKRLVQLEFDKNYITKLINEYENDSQTKELTSKDKELLIKIQKFKSERPVILKKIYKNKYIDSKFISKYLHDLYYSLIDLDEDLSLNLEVYKFEFNKIRQSKPENIIEEKEIIKNFPFEDKNEMYNFSKDKYKYYKINLISNMNIETTCKYANNIVDKFRYDGVFPIKTKKKSDFQSENFNEETEKLIDQVNFNKKNLRKRLLIDDDLYNSSEVCNFHGNTNTNININNYSSLYQNHEKTDIKNKENKQRTLININRIANPLNPINKNKKIEKINESDFAFKKIDVKRRFLKIFSTDLKSTLPNITKLINNKIPIQKSQIIEDFNKAFTFNNIDLQYNLLSQIDKQLNNKAK